MKMGTAGGLQYAQMYVSHDPYNKLHIAVYTFNARCKQVGVNETTYDPKGEEKWNNTSTQLIHIAKLNVGNVTSCTCPRC